MSKQYPPLERFVLGTPGETSIYFSGPNKESRGKRSGFHCLLAVLLGPQSHLTQHLWHYFPLSKKRHLTTQPVQHENASNWTHFLTTLLHLEMNVHLPQLKNHARSECSGHAEHHRPAGSSWMILRQCCHLLVTQPMSLHTITLHVFISTSSSVGLPLFFLHFLSHSSPSHFQQLLSLSITFSSLIVLHLDVACLSVILFISSF